MTPTFDGKLKTTTGQIKLTPTHTYKHKLRKKC